MKLTFKKKNTLIFFFLKDSDHVFLTSFFIDPVSCFGR